jgi:hypothetical protein
MSDKKKVKPDGDEKRSYFRVDDVISVVANPVAPGSEMSEEYLQSVSSSKAFSLMDSGSSGSSGPTHDEMEDNLNRSPDNAKLYSMITEIKTKLDFIINHIMLDKEGLTKAEKKLVNISASGLRFIIDYPASVNDVIEMKLLLPTFPPVAVFAYGKVIRVKSVGGNQFEVSLEYLNMADSVRNEIVQYTLAHQRETIRKIKESEGNE